MIDFAALAAVLLSLYVAPWGDDASSCTWGSPCRSLGRAYQAASSSARTIHVSGSPEDYLDSPAQRLPCGSKRLTVLGHGTPRMYGLDISASRITLDGIGVVMRGISVDFPPGCRIRDVTLRNLHTHPLDSMEDRRAVEATVTRLLRQGGDE